MSLESKCEHETLYFKGMQPKIDTNVPLYNCNSCREVLSPKSFGGTFDANQYEVNVIAYNGLSLVKNGK